jgi:transcription elongation factor GreA
MSAKKIYLTKDGVDELKKEYKELTDARRPEVLDRVTQARNMGDLSENAEYVAAREELAFIDGRIDELEELLRQVTIIKDDGAKSKTIKLGSKVHLQHGNKKDEYTLVGEWEADPMQKKISHESPLGKALIGKVVGEKIEVQAPAGKILYTVVAIN